MTHHSGKSLALRLFGTTTCGICAGPLGTLLGEGIAEQSAPSLKALNRRASLGKDFGEVGGRRNAQIVVENVLAGVMHDDWKDHAQSGAGRCATMIWNSWCLRRLPRHLNTLKRPWSAIRSMRAAPHSQEHRLSARSPKRMCGTFSPLKLRENFIRLSGRPEDLADLWLADLASLIDRWFWTGACQAVPSARHCRRPLPIPATLPDYLLSFSTTWDDEARSAPSRLDLGFQRVLLLDLRSSPIPKNTKR